MCSYCISVKSHFTFFLLTKKTHVSGVGVYMYVRQSAFPYDGIQGGFFWCHILNLRFCQIKSRITPIHCVAFKHIFSESVGIICDMCVFLCICASF